MERFVDEPETWVLNPSETFDNDDIPLEVCEAAEFLHIQEDPYWEAGIGSYAWVITFADGEPR